MRQQPAKPGRIRRWLVRLAVLVALLGTTYLVLTRTFVTRAIVLSRVKSVLGVDARADTLTIREGHVEATNLRLFAPGVVGPAGEVFAVKRLEAEIDLWSVLRGSPVVYSVELDEPIARLSQSVDDSSINVARLSKPDLGTRSGSSPSIPRVVIRGGVVELGEHVTDPSRIARGDGLFRSLRRIPVAGDVRPQPGSEGMFISFGEVDDAGRPIAGPGGLQIDGRITKDSITLNLGVISLSSWPADSLPGPLREPFRDLALEGLVHGAELVYSFAGGVEARARLSGVAMTLPVEVQPDVDREGNPLDMTPSDRAHRLRMQNVRGDLTLASDRLYGDLEGVVADLAYHVTFNTQGTSANAPLECTVTCRGFHLERKPEVLRFAPGLVRRRLEQFSDPTGLVDFKVTIRRGVPEGSRPGPVRVNGVLTLRDATAAFERFPYRFHKMTGDFAFSDDMIDIRRVEGVAPSGARLLATGHIEPLTDSAGVQVNVEVKDLPIDGTLQEALGQRGGIVDELLDLPTLASIREQGLLEGAAFEPGGRVSVLASVTRVAGSESEWHDTITVTMPRVGLLPKRFHYPLVAHDVTLIKEDDAAHIRGGWYEGPLGGRAEITVDAADVNALRDGASPTIVVRSTGVPINDLLLRALPGRAEDAAAEGFSLRGALLAARLRGTTDLSATLGPGAAPTDLVYTIDAALRDASSGPPGPQGTPRSALRGVAGTVHATDRLVALDITGHVVDAGGPDQGRASLTLRAERDAEGSLERLELAGSASDLDAAACLEDLIEPFYPPGAVPIRDLRTTYAPTGRLDVTLAIKQDAPRPPDVRVTLGALRNVTFDLGEGRTGMTSTAGSIGVRSTGDGPAVATFDGFEGTLSGPQGEDGRVRLHGAATIEGGPIGAERLVVGLTGGRLESPLTRWVLAKRAGPGLSDIVAETNPTGLFDLDVTLTPGPRGDWHADGTLRPRSVSLNLKGTPVVMPDGAGAIDFEPGRGRVRGMVFSGEGWDLAGDGSWLALPDGGTSVEGVLNARTSGVTSDVLSLLPTGLGEVARSLSFRPNGEVTASDLRLSMHYGDDGTLASYKAAGVVGLTNASLDPGAVLDHVRGRVEFTAERGKGDPAPRFDIRGLMDSVQGAGVSMTDARVRIVGEPDGSVYAPQIDADCHGGRFSGDAVLGPEAPEGRPYTFSARLSGVRFAPLLADLRATPQEDGATSGEDESRGILDASFSIAGRVDRPESRRGRGQGTVGGGRVVNLPVLVPLIRATNLELPFSERLDYATADFYVQGPLIKFEELVVSSRSVEIVGYGVMSWPEGDLDLRLRPKARTRIPFFTAVMEGLRNELFAASITGTIRDPKAEYRTLLGTSRVLEDMFGGGEAGRLDAIEERLGDRVPNRPRPKPPISAGR